MRLAPRFILQWQYAYPDPKRCQQIRYVKHYVRTRDRFVIAQTFSSRCHSLCFLFVGVGVIGLGVTAGILMSAYWASDGAPIVSAVAQVCFAYYIRTGLNYLKAFCCAQIIRRPAPSDKRAVAEHADNDTELATTSST